MQGLYSIAELVQSSNTDNVHTVVVFLKSTIDKRFNDKVFNSFKNIKSLIENNKDTSVFFSIKDALIKISEITRGN